MNPLRVQDVHHASLRCVQHGCVASMNAQPAAVCLKTGCLSRDYTEKLLDEFTETTQKLSDFASEHPGCMAGQKEQDAPLPVDGPVEELEKQSSPE